ncbi:M16 family metallopeptidase [Planococcus sp. CAU13]|uniref:M16 family metallopeptidase n=1 Tax=Planococcus sp. CAU13 TaxID=1541197 RepID=UPI00052FE12B|nr:pitrilysin family protein [Planococcus sp. CAU13]
MVDTFICDNGVRIVSEQIPHVRSVAVGIFVKAGSRDEEREENGITHFIEHMLFKGTPTRSAKEIAREFDRIGGDINAYTSKEYTCYYAKVIDEHAGHAVNILSDMFFNSLMDPAEIERERQVVLEEISMTEDMPDDDVHEQLWRVMYPHHSMGAPILGSETTLKKFDAAAIRDFMDRFYTPHNSVVSVAGNISPALIQQIAGVFGNFKRSDYRKPYQAPGFTAGTSIRHKDIEQGHLCYGYPGLSINDPHLYDMAVMNNILGGTMSSRLFQEIREERGLAYSIYSYHSAYSDHGTLAIYGGTSNEQLPELQEKILESIRTMYTAGLTKQEVVDSKEQFKGNLLLGMESTSGRMSRNGKHELLLGKHITYDEVLKKIDGVSLEKVQYTLELLKDAPAQSIICPKETSSQS